jgi:3-deoxy-D-manno-octulosonate 8-phosphate phosphatase (KDO 8-P phosphatase)
MVSEEIYKKIQPIKVVIFDIDAVLTDGRIIYGDYGDELKHYDVQDGFGMVLLTRAGLKTAIISAKKCRINSRRAKDLKVELLMQNAFDKQKALEKLVKKMKVQPSECCYIGDDLIDIPVFKRVGFAVAVNNARPEAKEYAHYVTEKSGGRGAVRELCDMILRAQGKWADVTKKYFAS